MKKLYLLLLAGFISLIVNSQVIVSDDFSNPDNWYIPTGTFKWTIGNTENQYMPGFASTSGANYAIFDSELAGTGEQDVKLYYNYKIGLKAGKKPHIRFQHWFKQWDYEGIYFFICTNNGNLDSTHYKLLNIDLYQNDATQNPDTVDIDLSEYIPEDDSIYFGFEYYSTYGENYAWYIDDVKLYYEYPANEVELLNTSALGKLPIGYGTPQKVKALVRNNGANTQTNLQVKLDISGSNSFTNIKTIPSLKTDDTVTVIFDSFTPTKLGTNNVNVSIPDDGNNDNNSLNFKQIVTYNTFSYADDTSHVSIGLGITKGSGMLVSKFHINKPKSVQKINVCFSNDTRSLKKQVFAVLLSAEGKIIAKSTNYIIQNEDLGKYHLFMLDSFPVLNNTDFYAGLAQEEAGDAYYPVGTQNELTVPLESYYWTGDLLPSALFMNTDFSYRLMIDAVVGDPAPKICLVSADTISGKNQIIWQKQNSGSIKGYKIYRESNKANVYDSIGFVKYNQLSVFTDPKDVNRFQRKYKISAVDTMNVESEKSPYHKTLLLEYNGNVGYVNMIWSNYDVEGQALKFDSYVIYKGSDSTKLTAIDTIPASDGVLLYKDFDPLALQYQMFYRVAGLLRNGCDTEKLLKGGGGIYVQAVSNMEDNRLRATYVPNKMVSDFGVNIYPNPVTSKSSISYNLKTASQVKLDVFTLTGQKVISLLNQKEAAGVYTHTFGNKLNNGIYVIKLTINGLPISNKVVKLK